YELVTHDLHYRTRNPEAAYELDPNLFMNRWYREHVGGASLTHPDWNGFRDPDEIIYRTYTTLQDMQEDYVDTVLDEHERSGHDLTLSASWVATLARVYTPGPYLLHPLQ